MILKKTFCVQYITILISTEYFSKKLCFAFLPGKGLFFPDFGYYITKSSEYVLNYYRNLTIFVETKLLRIIQYLV